MNFKKIDVSNCKELTDLSSVDINIQEFYRIIEIIKLALKSIGVNLEGMQVYYQRNVDTTSILAIKVSQGKDSDIDNYMFNGCKAWKHGSNVSCDVYMQSEAKSAQKSMKLANLISRDIVDFFDEIENDLLKNNKFDLSLSLIMPLDIKKEKEENNIKKLVKRILKK